MRNIKENEINKNKSEVIKKGVTKVDNLKTLEVNSIKIYNLSNIYVH